MNMVKRATRAADTLQQRHAWLAVPVAVWKKFGDDQAGNLAALVAYYLQAELTLYAVEINVVRALRLWPRSIAPPPYTEQDRRAFQLYTQVEKRGEDMDTVAGESGSKR